MKLFKITLVILLSVIKLQAQGYSSHTGQVATNHLIKITAESLKNEMDGYRAYVINVLNKGTFKDCSIKGSVHIPIGQLKKIARKKLNSRRWKLDKQIVVYCASYECPLSKYAFKILRELGFTNIKAYEGGMREWKQKGYPSTGQCNAGYLKG